MLSLIILETRFPHSEALPLSHIKFRVNFMDYVPLFDEIMIFANLRKGNDIPVLIAEKTQGKKELDLLDESLFNSLIAVP